MIDSFYQSLQTALNHNQRGKISPSEFNALLFEAMKEIHVGLFADLRKLQYRKMRLQATGNYGDEAAHLEQAIEYYISEQTLPMVNGTCKLPKNIFTLNSVFDENGEYEKVSLLQFNKLTRSKRMRPTACNPVYALKNNGITASPKPSSIDVSYNRMLTPPKWTYREVNGKALFDPDKPDFQDIDMPPILLPQLFTKALQLAGLNLQQQEIAQYVAQVKQEQAMDQSG